MKDGGRRFLCLSSRFYFGYAVDGRRGQARVCLFLFRLSLVERMNRTWGEGGVLLGDLSFDLFIIF